MGIVMERIKLTNPFDLEKVAEGLIAPEAVRSVELDALVDTGATELAIPAEAARALGLRESGTRPAKLADGRVVQLARVLGIRIEILGRDMTCDALLLPEGSTTLIGQIPLEGLDLVVDPRRRELRVNPESPDAPLVHLLAAAQ
jgi:clan AA aspartic protease